MYKDYTFLDDDHIPIFGGHQGCTDSVGAFYILVAFSSTVSSAHFGGRLIIFSD